MTPFLKNTLSMLGIAALTMATTLVAVNSSSVSAAEGEDQNVESVKVEIKPVLAQASLDIDNCTFTLKMDKEVYSGDDKPVLTVEATNPGKESVTRSVVVTMYGRDLNSRGRMPSIAMPLFTKTVEFTLAAGETKSTTVETGRTMPAAQAISMGMGKVNPNGEAFDEIEKALPRVKSVN